MTITTYSVGTDHKNVGATGYGLMGLTLDPDRNIDDSRRNECLETAIKGGATMWNSADIYGRPDPTLNLQMLGKYFAKHPEDVDKVYLTVKGGFIPLIIAPDAPNGTRGMIRESIFRTRDLLGINKPFDMFCLGRVGKVPIEESVRAIKEAVDEGLVKDIGISEVSAETLRRAHSVAPITAVEVEYSMFSREVEFNGLFQACKELGVVVIAYSPLRKGILTNSVKPESLSENDFRRTFDGFQPEHFDKNQVLVEKVCKIAKRKNATPGQIALSWIRTLSNTGSYPVIIPIPGSTNPERIKENNTHVELSAEDMREIDEALSGFKRSGYRYNENTDKLYQ